MIVYLTTNLINGRKYIGKDTRNRPSYLGSGKILKQAIKKYGKKNIKKEILAHANNVKELEYLEKYYIRYYNADDSIDFYNIMGGGTGGKTIDQSFKKVKVYQFTITGDFIREWDSAKDAANYLNIDRSKIVTACRTGNSCSEFLWSKTNTFININNIKHRHICKIIQLSKSSVILKEWDNLGDIERNLGFNRANIHKCLKNKAKTMYGFKWKYK
jgi:hypothetical protein